MVLTSYSLENAGPRDWPTLRDLLIRAGDGHRCPELAAATAGAGGPAEAWRERMAGLCGGGRVALFVRDDRHEARGFIAAYVDGAGEERHVVVRHLLVPTTDAALVRTTHVLLDRVEDWASRQLAAELLMEVDSRDAAMADLLRSRGYAPTGVTRPGFAELVGAESAAVAAGARASGPARRENGSAAAEWRRPIRAVRRATGRAIFAVAS